LFIWKANEGNFIEMGKYPATLYSKLMNWNIASRVYDNAYSCRTRGDILYQHRGCIRPKLFDPTLLRGKA